MVSIESPEHSSLSKGQIIGYNVLDLTAKVLAKNEETNENDILQEISVAHLHPLSEVYNMISSFVFLFQWTQYPLISFLLRS